MAKERAWWDLDLHDQRMDDLSDADRDHVAGLIKEGFTSGELVKDEEDPGRRPRNNSRREIQ
jgi:hypothetical protein